MKRFLNKVTNEIEEADSYTKLFAFSNNSNYEYIEEVEDEKEVEEVGEKKIKGRKLKNGGDNDEIQEQKNKPSDSSFNA